MRSILKIIVLSLFIFSSLESVSGQKIVFNYTASGYDVKPNYGTIEIVIERSGRYCEIDVFTDGSGVHDKVEAAKWKSMLAATQTKEDSLKLMKKAPKDKTVRRKYELTIEEFENIEKAITSIDSSKIHENIGKMILHGDIFEIKYGNHFNSIKYKVQSPEYRGKKRIPNFSKACRLILEAAKIKPRKVL